MPSKNSIKQYVEGGYYHVYNRGVDKRIIFGDEQDYAVFLRFMKEYLLPPNHPDLEALKLLWPRRKPINCYDDVELLAYCLMPNHFHLFVKQKTPKGLIAFMKAISTNYAMYFNHKRDRVGPLFQDRYKAVLVRSDSYSAHITRYIHANPRELLTRDSSLQQLQGYSYSSYPMYLGLKKCEWLKPEETLAMFGDSDNKSRKLYKEFVEDDNAIEKSAEILGELTIE